MRIEERQGDAGATAEELIAAFRCVRSRTDALTAPLSPEDQCLQSMPSCSPVKWHRAHTSWFFETFLLVPRGVAPLHAAWASLFNSYYVSLGPRNPRPKRGLLSRPSADEVTAYRRWVDGRVMAVLEAASPRELSAIEPMLTLGLAHEEQHQELIMTDLLHAFSENPLRPAYRSPNDAKAPSAPRAARTTPLSFQTFDGGVREVGTDASAGFCFDHEEPKHRTFVEPFSIANRLVTVGEWKAFAAAGGYETASLWLSDGFDWVQAHGVDAPLYAVRDGGALVAFGLDGTRELRDDEPLSHVSFYEADAIARFLDARLPTEQEWEIAVASSRRDPRVGNFVDDGSLRPLPVANDETLAQAFGDVWEWTSSPYAPYPGFRPREGAIGEYNGKFMANQIVLRGGSCFTPRGHVRSTYRNFWYPDTRFQMSGVRVARSVRRG